MVGWRILLWAVLVLAALSFLYLVRGILSPFILAVIISAILEPTIRRLRLRGWSRPTAVLAVFMSFLLVVIVTGAWLLPIVGTQLSTMRDKFTQIATAWTTPDTNELIFVRWNPVVRAESTGDTNAIDKFLEANRPLLDRLNLPTRSQAYIQKYIEPRRGEIAKAIEGFFGSFIGIASGMASQIFLLLFAPLLAFMMMMDMEQLKRRSVTWIPPTIRSSTVAILSDIGDVFMKYLRGVTTAVTGYMIVMSILLTLLGAPYSVLIGIIVGIVYLIPYLNGIISITLIFTLTGLSERTGDWLFHFQSSWVFAIVVSAIFLITHLIYDSLLFPRLVGKSVGLHPIVSMFVIFSGGALFGIIGMIIAFPLAGSVKVILDRLLGVAMTTQETLALPTVPLRHRTSAST